ncbi:hypothetical protein SARC_07013 [Sphaeroforma arctica JP610]|uniref:alpha-1,2-Mannosidase n=1 Tax=Sphaeroforma arctica JP610 TaxID=667725 RepID=A0A0L0FVR5_9EUKA|nr:hypothetical protein SARC_07013 [Sphaeroforma arctica JP610]KNC80636.1 hypothetical protein SARC_07013 [Sphaeroforma arctica JP610]|eukprot:XP_014154538.1 hypothetical protein SARC_07013 [Sphaeroforma arctica JP610]
MGRFVHLTTGKAHGRAAIAEFGTLQLEFEYLSDITGDRTYRDIVYIIRDTMNAAKTDNFYGANFVAGAKKPFTGKVTMGGEVDSFYEYLLKGWILGGRVDEVQEKMYYDMADAFMDHNWVNKTSVGGFSYLKENATTNNLEHLACFAGGMYGLGAQYTTGDRVKQNSRYMDVAEQMTRTCHQGYINTKTGLAGEKWTMDTKTGNPLKPSKGGLEYILRPETIESYVYMYRYTKDEKYREWGLEYIEALNTHAKVEFGYDSVKNVWTDRREFMDNTPSFFFAETLKYLYLLYSDDDTIGFNDFVFNTEAHPIPIKGRPSRDTPRYSGFSVTPPIKFGQRAHSQEAPDVEQAANVNVNHFKPKNKVDLVQGDRQVKQEDVFNDEPIPEGVNDAAKQVKRAQLRAQAEAEAQNNQAQPPRAAVVLKWDKPAQEEEKLADNDDEGVDKEDAKEGDLANGDIADGEQDDNIAVQNAGLNKEGYADKNGDEVVDNDVGGVQKDFEADEDLTNEDVYALNKEIEQLRKDVKKL